MALNQPIFASRVAGITGVFHQTVGSNLKHLINIFAYLFQVITRITTSSSKVV
jgi:hypothetical protein